MDTEILTAYKALCEAVGPEALTLNHYDLAKTTKIGTPEDWKKFLMEPEVADWISSELAVIQDSELRKILHNISSSHSVGQAQIIGALSKLTDQKTKSEGPVFIYSYIPLSIEQEKALNINKLDHDPFI
jgi:hypothetical protein